MTSKIKKTLMIVAACFALGVSATGVGYYISDVIAEYNEVTPNITITKNVDLYTFRDGKYKDFANPWGSFYSGGSINKATGWLYESNQNNASIMLFDEVIGDFSIVMQPLQEEHNGTVDTAISSGAKLNWDYMQFVFTDKADPSNILKVDFYESGWYTYNIELNYKGSTHFSYNYGGESFGGYGNYSRWNYVMRVSFDEMIKKYYDDFTYRVTGFDSYSVSMSMGVKNWGNQQNKTLMIYELCGQKLGGETITDNAAPQFEYVPLNGVVNNTYSVLPVKGGFDVIDGLISESAFSYKVFDPAGNAVSLDNTKSFTPTQAGKYTLSVGVKDTAGLENKQEYEFEIFETYPDATFAFDSEYKSEYALNTPLKLLRPTSAISAITGNEIDYTVELYCGEEKVKAFGMNDSVVPYELLKTGSYKIVYKTATETGGYTEKVFTFETVLAPYVPEFEEKVIGLGETYETAIVYAVYNGQSKLMDATVIDPDGEMVAVDKDGMFLADTLGDYRIKYSTKFGDVTAETEEILHCEVIAGNLFINTTGIEKILYNRDTTLYSEPGNGMEVYTTQGGILSSIPFDLNLVETDMLLKLNASTYENVGTMGQMTISLVDANDSSNAVSMTIWQSPWSFEVVYITYSYKSKNGDTIMTSPSATSWSEAYGTSYTGTTVGASAGGYNGMTKYGTSLKGGLKGMDFLEFHFDHTTGAFYRNNEPLFSIADPACMGPTRVWGGFSTGEAYFTITVDSAASNCAYNIVEFLGQSLSGETIDDVTPPYLGLNESAYFEDPNELPKAIVGKAYPIPEYYVEDYFAGIETHKVRVMDAMGSGVTIKNGAFVPTSAGTYYLHYQVTDKLGNKTEMLLTLEALEEKDYFTIAWEKEPATAYTGNTYVIPKLAIDSQISKLVIEESIVCGETTVDPASRTLKLMALNDIVVKVKAIDYVGNILEKEYTIQVNPSELPVLDIESGMPNSVQIGSEITVPSFIAYDFNLAANEAGYHPEKWIEVNGVRKDTLTFMVTEDMLEAGKLSIVYCSGASDKITRSEEYIVPVIDPVYIGDYFVADKPITVTHEKVATLFTFTEDTTLQVANNLAVSKLMFKFDVDSNSKAESVSIRIEDFKDSATAVLLTLKPMDNYYSYLSVNNSEETIIVPGSFSNDQEFFVAYYNNDSKILTDVYGNLVCTLETTEQGLAFNGFTSGSVRISFHVDCREGGSVGLRMYQISNQLIINRFKSGEPIAYTDNTAPVLQLTKALRNVKLTKGSEFELPAAKAYDFCSEKATATMSLTSPANTTLLDGVSCETATSYRFDEYGVYTLTYTMSDGNKSYTQSYKIEVIDDTLPTISVTDTKDIVIKAGDSFVVPTAMATDGVSDVMLYVFLVDEWHLTPLSVDQSVMIEKAGKYVLRYYAVDDSYNTTEVLVNVYMV